MRDILFKAKRIDNGEWVEGYYSPHPHPFSGFLKDFIFAPYYDTEKECGYDNGYQIDPNTLCQYTGLTDKNGNKIWENDVVNGHEKRGAAFFHCIVKHNDRKARFDVKAMDCMFPLCIEEYDEDFFMNGLDYEVIGNIFDNPELIEGQV